MVITLKTFKTDTFQFTAPDVLTTDGTTRTSSQVSAHSIRAGERENETTQATEFAYDKTFTYTYDANGNILTVSDGTNTTTYTYDYANQLIREDNEAANLSWTWEYDDAGNILSHSQYDYTTGELGTATSSVNYTYGDTNWGDLLTGYGNSTITSDSIGNMTSFGGWTFTWEHGRELASLSKDGTTWTNTYNADGLRTKRTTCAVCTGSTTCEACIAGTSNVTTYNYVYNGSSLSQMSVGTHLLNFAYDASGAPMAVTYDGVTYYYATNLQGDIIAILDGSGNAVVQYMYDAWGKLWETTGSMATTLGVHNPLRYRGYVYDPESSLYYLQSRYYDPELGRFINADIYPTTGQGLLGNNMFAYCNNDPTNHYDTDGRMPQAVEDAIIHNKVLKEICGQNGDLRMTQTCIYYNQIDAKNGWGFCDLYNISTGEVWELKKNSNNYSCTTIAAKAQLGRYVGGRLKHYPDLQLFTPYATQIASGTTSLTMNGYNYSISYWNEGEGILRYSYTKNKTETRKTVEAFATAAAVVAVVAYCAPSLLPGMVAAIPYAVAY